MKLTTQSSKHAIMLLAVLVSLADQSAGSLDGGVIRIQLDQIWDHVDPKISAWRIEDYVGTRW